MEEPHHRIAVFDRGREELAIEPKMQRNRFEDAATCIFERGEKLGEGVAKAPDFSGPDIGCHIFGQRMVFG